MTPQEFARAVDVIAFSHASKNAAVGAGASEQLGENRDGDRDGAHRYAAFAAFGDARRQLSNFARAPTGVVVGGALFPSVEHALHAAKGTLIGTPAALAEANKFWVGGAYADASGPELKAFGGKRNAALNLGPRVRDWDAHAGAAAMRAAVYSRVERDPRFRAILAATGDAVLVHQVRGHQDVRLGRILMDARDALAAPSPAPAAAPAAAAAAAAPAAAAPLSLTSPSRSRSPSRSPSRSLRSPSRSAEGEREGEEEKERGDGSKSGDDDDALDALEGELVRVRGNLERVLDDVRALDARGARSSEMRALRFRQARALKARADAAATRLGDALVDVGLEPEDDPLLA